jgi:hypothetical protein
MPSSLALPPRTVLFNAKDYGAVGDGVTNDRPAIQAAIDACHTAGGGEVSLPPGTYLINVHPTLANVGVLLTNNVRLRGSGREATTLLLASGANAHVVYFVDDSSDVAVSDLTIDGNHSNQTVDCHGIRLNRAVRGHVARVHVTGIRRYGITDQGANYDSHLEDVEVDNVSNFVGNGDGFDFKRTVRLRITRCYAHNCAANGFDIRGQWTSITDSMAANNGGVGFSQRMFTVSAEDPAEAARQEYMLISNCSARDNGQDGFWIEGEPVPDATFIARQVIVNCLAKNNGVSGFRLEGSSISHHLTNCVAEGNVTGFGINANDVATYALKMVNCSALTNTGVGISAAAVNGIGYEFANCEAAGNGSYGWRLFGEHHSIVNPRASGNALYGMRLEAASDCVILGGSFSPAAGIIGIRVEDDRNTILGTVFDGAGTGVATTAGADATVLAFCNFNDVSGTKLSNGGTNTLALYNAGVTNINSTDFATTGSIAAGTNPAGAGPIRIPNANFVTSRNAANSGNVSLIGANASDRVQVGAVGQILLNATPGIGFYNVAPVARAGAYTQTYSTADKTHANATAASVTHGVGTADATVDDVGASFSQTTLNNNFKELTTQTNALIADVADAKQLLNSVIDDLQAYGLFQ